MIIIDQVPRWYVDRNVGHAVAGCGNGQIHTACGTIHIGPCAADTQTERPKRICRKCRVRLNVATLIQQ